MPRRLPCAVTLATLALAVASAGAETIFVTSGSGGMGGPDCTLRNAITAANTDTPWTTTRRRLTGCRRSSWK